MWCIEDPFAPSATASKTIMALRWSLQLTAPTSTTTSGTRFLSWGRFLLVGKLPEQLLGQCSVNVSTTPNMHKGMEEHKDNNYSTVTSLKNGLMQLVWPDVDAVLAIATWILRAGTLIAALTVSKSVEGKHLVYITRPALYYLTTDGVKEKRRRKGLVSSRWHSMASSINPGARHSHAYNRAYR